MTGDDVSIETLKSIKAHIHAYQGHWGLWDHKCQYKLMYSTKVYGIVEGERKTIPDTERIK